MILTQEKKTIKRDRELTQMLQLAERGLKATTVTVVKKLMIICS